MSAGIIGLIIAWGRGGECGAVGEVFRARISGLRLRLHQSTLDSLSSKYFSQATQKLDFLAAKLVLA